MTETDQHCAGCGEGDPYFRCQGVGVTVDELAAAVAERLHKSLLQIPQEIAEALKPEAGSCYLIPLGRGPQSIRLQSLVLVDGGVEVRLTDFLGKHLFSRVLHP